MNDHEAEPEIVTSAIRRAQQIVQEFTTILQAMGWDAIMLSITRVIEVAPGDFRAPGATATVLDPVRCGPVGAQIAEVLRRQADLIEARAGGEVTSGCVHDQSNYASGLREWPR